MSELSRVFHRSRVYNLYIVEYYRTLMIYKEPIKVVFGQGTTYLTNQRATKLIV